MALLNFLINIHKLALQRFWGTIVEKNNPIKLSCLYICTIYFFTNDPNSL